MSTDRSEIITNEHPWVLRCLVTLGDDNAQVAIGADLTRLTGSIVLASKAPRGMKLELLVDGEPHAVTWGLPSVWAAKLFPQGKNKGRARFLAEGLPASAQEAQLVLIDPADNTRVVIATRKTKVIAGAPETIARVSKKLTALLASGERIPAMHAALLSILSAVPAANRDPAWMECMAMVDALYLENPRENFALVNRLKEVRTSAGQPEKFTEFLAQLQSAIHPKLLTRRGYIVPFAHRDEAVIWQDTAALTKGVTQASGAPCFIVGSTLLGAARNGHLPADESEIFLAVLLTGREPKALAQEWINLRARLAEAAMVERNFEIQEKLNCHLICKSSVVNLFPAWVSEGQTVFLYPHASDEIAKDSLLPLAVTVVCGVSVPVPANAEAFLAGTHGADWKTVDSSTPTDWKMVRTRYEEFVSEFHRLKNQFDIP